MARADSGVVIPQRQGEAPRMGLGFSLPKVLSPKFQLNLLQATVSMYNLSARDLE